ncbi:MAG: tetratricopeptide repeat protein [Lysobacteraceae bacterium]|nr:MAG: tetratricopeptide repeat protein [Xanthomonadaceae bacterium]
MSLDDVQRMLAQSRFAEAEQLLHPLIARSPHDPALHRTLAVIAQATGRGELAVRAMRHAAAMAPQSAPLQMELGQVLAGVGAVDEALSAFRSATELQPDLAAAWYFLGMTLYGAQRDAEALDALRRAHALAPQHPQVLRALAETEYALEHHETALALFETIASAEASGQNRGDSSPNDPHRNDSNRNDTNRNDSNQRDGRPRDPSLFLRRSQCLRKTGAPQAALRIVREGIESCPEDAPLWMELGWVLEDLGDAMEAQQAYARARALRPGWADPLGAAIALARGDAPEDLIREAETLLAHGALPAAQQAYLHHVLGKRDDARRAFVAAAGHWRAANELRRASDGAFDRDAFAAMIQTVVATWDARALHHAHARALRDERPIFVLGMPRSGTTLVEQIIAAHPLAHGCGELTGIVGIAHDLAAAHGDSADDRSIGAAAAGFAYGVSRRIDPDRIDAAWLNRHATAYLDAAARMAGRDARRLVDKQPYNFLHIGLISALFADAKIVWCRRDPRDIALSIYSESFSPMATYATDLGDIHNVIEGQERLMRHWQAVSPLPILEMRYETLVNDLDGQARTLLAFCGLDWDPACLQFHASGRSVQTLSRWQVRQPVHTRSVGRWRNYPDWFADGPVAV